ncbi:DEAD/DEAH box helicase [Gordonibacter sp. An230]|uniref:DEAD/DEAH box helicase n=1 Tax=Gordonibacter sp. An230 TaxID=1965592 RepID=UPI000B3948DD|nr:DEAD/DEAH box helicase [Gordonibacter sp. An230]OUO91738.1 DEAD/DEAH box helicase [Gordonibacter sp. An230]
MSNFADLGLSPAALAAVERLGYEQPTPVQEQAIPLVLEGRDLIAAASTGTGKTAAFLLPTLSTLPRGTRGKRAPRVLVVSPTRELAQQIARTCMQIARKTGHFVTTVFGGTPYGPQIKEIRRGTDVLIATPGRLNDLMQRDVVDLGSIEVLVLDEADRMLDMGFLPAVTTIVNATPAERQTLLFSATIDRSIEKNLGSLLNDPAVVEIARNGETAKTVEQFMMPIKNLDKPKLLHAVLDEKGSERVIVFARTKFRTEECAEELRRAGYSAESIHSDKSQGQRRRALENFRRGKTSILVATDVLARGIDVPDVDHVINFDLPDMPEDYVHRIGRTGRAGEQGYAISFVTRESRRTLADIEKLIGKEIPLMELETYELDLSLLKKPAKGKGTRGGGRSARPKDARRGRPASKDARSTRDSRSGRTSRTGNRNAEHARKRLELKEKRAQAAAKKPAAGPAKKRAAGGYDYSKFVSADHWTD